MPDPTATGHHWQLYADDCCTVLVGLDEASFDACFCDPPYGLNFMGKSWDGVVPDKKVWSAVLRVLKPGAMLLAFGGTRTWHRLACAIEDAGFEIRDTLMWLYGSGFPKSHDISKAIDKAAGAERKIIETYIARGFSETSPTKDGRNQWAAGEVINKVGVRSAPATDLSRRWSGYGTALKPAWEPIILAIKPLDGTFAQNAEKHGVAGLNVDGGRIPAEPRKIDNYPSIGSQGCISRGHGGGEGHAGESYTTHIEQKGRWPANVLLDEEAAEMLDEQSGQSKSQGGRSGHTGAYGGGYKREYYDGKKPGFNDFGGASRFFYTSKADNLERENGLKGFMPCLMCHDLDTSYHISHKGTIFHIREAGQGSVPSTRGIRQSWKDYRASGRKGPSPEWSLTKCRRNSHPTVKPLALCRHLATLILPPKRDAPRRLLVPFAGTGSEMIGAKEAGWDEVVGVEISPEYCEIATARLALPLLDAAHGAAP